MATESRCSLNNMLQAIIGVGNTEINQSYPPNIYEAQRNTVTSLLLSQLAKEYPSNQQVIDILRPYVIVEKIPVKNGYVDLPAEYRNLLGNPSINIKPKGMDCGDKNDDAVIIDSEQEFKTANLKAGCQKRPVIIKPQSEFDYETTSTYKFPTYFDPICMYYGKNQLKVCPYDIASVEIQYIKKEENCVVSYITQPDDTWIIDPNTSTNDLWDSNAFDPIYNAMITLYSAFTRDKDMREYSVILKQLGVF